MAPPESPPSRRRPARLPAYESRALYGAIIVSLPALLALSYVLFMGRPSLRSSAVLLVAVAIITVWLARWHYRRMIRPIHTLASLLEALREGDYSLRGRQGSVLGDVIYDINALAERLQRERLQFEESSYLLGKTLAALDNAVFVFDEQDQLRLINPAAQRLMRAERHQLFGRSAQQLGLQILLDTPSGELRSHAFPGRHGRFEIRHAPLRTGGRGGQLLVINDVGRVLREEERQAWQRLLRVLGHEVNNSLAPIQSLAGTLAIVVQREPLPHDWREDFHAGLEVIGHRAGALARFLSRYSQLAKLPPPQPQAVDLATLMAKLARLDSRVLVHVSPGPACQLRVDPDQIEQALINLLRNAVEASLPEKGGVCLCWRVESDQVVIDVLDEGLGPPLSDNLFVPFFTTKPGGSGIGLALARQIAEAHQGGVSLLPRDDRAGAIASLWLPVGKQARFSSGEFSRP